MSSSHVADVGAQALQPGLLGTRGGECHSLISMPHNVNIAEFQFEVQSKVSRPSRFLKSVESRELLSSVSRHMEAFIEVLEKLLRLLYLFISAFFLSLYIIVSITQTTWSRRSGRQRHSDISMGHFWCSWWKYVVEFWLKDSSPAQVWTLEDKQPGLAAARLPKLLLIYTVQSNWSIICSFHVMCFKL